MLILISNDLRYDYFHDNVTTCSIMKLYHANSLPFRDFIYYRLLTAKNDHFNSQLRQCDNNVINLS